MLNRGAGIGTVTAALVLSLFLAGCGHSEDTVVPSRNDLASEPSRVLVGKTYPSREKISVGMSASAVEKAVGRPSERLESHGQDVFEKWTYLYADGRLMLNLRAGKVSKIDTTFY